jgi:hypothetical protein
MERHRTQQRHGRRGFVFSLRLTDEQRAELERLQRQGGGPRRPGPWLVWRALEGGAPGPVLPPPAIARVVPRRLIDTLAPEPGPGTTSTRSEPRRGPGNTPPAALADRLVLDLCAGSGSWSQPYERAGYRVVRVSLPADDVRTYVPPPGPVWGILAAPPCDQFSLARNGHTASPRDLVRGMECVNACLRIVQQCAPRWWALENPVGLLSRWLGTPRDVWEPCDFGDPWTKRTALWGSFALPRRGPYVVPRGGGPLCTVCDPARRRSTWCSSSAHRAITPAGFARAFFEANP